MVQPVAAIQTSADRTSNRAGSFLDPVSSVRSIKNRCIRRASCEPRRTMLGARLSLRGLGLRECSRRRRVESFSARFSAGGATRCTLGNGNACSSTEFLDRVAALTQLPQSPRVSMDEAQLTFSPERLSFLHESRRVSNERMLRHLGVKLKYGDMDAGIRHSLESS